MVLFVYNNTRGARQIPTFNNVADFCGIVKRSGFSDDNFGIINKLWQNRM